MLVLYVQLAANYSLNYANQLFLFLAQHNFSVFKQLPGLASKAKEKYLPILGRKYPDAYLSVDPYASSHCSTPNSLQHCWKY